MSLPVNASAAFCLLQLQTRISGNGLIATCSIDPDLVALVVALQSSECNGRLKAVMFPEIDTGIGSERILLRSLLLPMCANSDERIGPFATRTTAQS